MVLEAGPELDLRVYLTVFGERKSRIPPYSTNALTAKRLGGTLEAMGVSMHVEEFESSWYCVLTERGQRIATGSGNTDAVAIARAVAHMRPGTFREPMLRPRRVETDPQRRPWRRVPLRHCAACGTPLGPSRFTGLCNPCDWRRIKSQRAETDTRRSTRP